MLGLEGCFFSRFFVVFSRENHHVTRCVVPVEVAETMDQVVRMIQLGFG